MDHLERYFGAFAIPNLAWVLVSGQAVGMYLGMTQNPLIDQWSMSGEKVALGEYHRLFLFPFLPPGFGILVIFCLYFFLLMGTALENQWGKFRFNLYILIAYLSTLAVAFMIPEVQIGSGYIGTSVFLAFAWLFPEFVIMLFFVLPVKIKYVALITWIYYLMELSFGDWMSRGLVLASISNFLLFFGSDLYYRARGGHRSMKHAVTQIKAKHQAFHECAVCGITEKDDRKMDFRICSQCEGSYEYCANHLQTHEHRRLSSHVVPAREETTT
ncbi:MAG: hypothetical protein ACKVT0_15950 [Planctomycetaceae bacterium]